MRAELDTWCRLGCRFGGTITEWFCSLRLPSVPHGRAGCSRACHSPESGNPVPGTRRIPRFVDSCVRRNDSVQLMRRRLTGGRKNGHTPSAGLTKTRRLQIVPRYLHWLTMAKKSPSESKKAANVGKPSSLVDTRVVYCGDNLDQLRRLPDACVDLVYILTRPSTRIATTRSSGARRRRNGRSRTATARPPPTSTSCDPAASSCTESSKRPALLLPL